jgi:hypothetical protein
LSSLDNDIDATRSAVRLDERECTRLRGQKVYLVTQEYFQDLSLKVDVKKINDAVLGVCTLVLSYAKAANKPINKDNLNNQEISPVSLAPWFLQYAVNCILT